MKVQHFKIINLILFIIFGMIIVFSQINNNLEKENYKKRILLLEKNLKKETSYNRCLYNIKFNNSKLQNEINILMIDREKNKRQINQILEKMNDIDLDYSTLNTLIKQDKESQIETFIKDVYNKKYLDK